MFLLTSKTSKKDLVQALAEDLKNPNSSFVIQVHSLPSFLNTPISFKVFSYEISNYPKEVFWLSDEEIIMDFLQDCKARIEPNFLQNFIRQKQKFLPEKKYIRIPTTTKTVEIDFSLVSRKKYPSKIEWNTTSSQKIQEIRKDKVTSMENLNNLESQAQIKTFSFSFKNKQTLNSKNFFSKNIYTTSSLLENEKKNTPFQQDLDQWISKIENAKKNINKQSKSKQQWSLSNEIRKLEFPRVLLKVPQKLTFSFIVIVILFFLASGILFTFFPTQVFTLELSPIKEVKEVNFDFLEKDLEKYEYTIFAESKIPATGQKTVVTDRAKGKVKLINNSNRPILITNGGFKLITEDGQKVYTHVLDSKLPETINIPGNNLDTALEVEVQADQNGDIFNLPKNTRMNITNLKGEKVCLNCYGLSTTDIQNQIFLDEKIVTEENHKQLIKENEDKLKKMRLEKIDQLNRDQCFVPKKNDWLRVLKTDYFFSKDVGSPSTEVGLKTQEKIQVLCAPRNRVSNFFEKQEHEVFNIYQINVLEEENRESNLSRNTAFNLKLKIEFSRYDKINTQEISTSLEQNRLEEVEKNLKIRYPSLKKISRSDQGLKIPGINPRTNIDIIHKEELEN